MAASLAWKKRLSMLSSDVLRLHLPGPRTSCGDCALPPALPLGALTGLLVLGDGCAALIPRPVTFVGLSVVFNRVVLGVSSCVGVPCELSTLDFRAKDRGVILPFGGVSLSVSSCLTRGVTLAGALTVDGVLEVVGLVDGEDAAIMRGVCGVRATRVDASVGFRGLPVLLRSAMTVGSYGGGGIWPSVSNTLQHQAPQPSTAVLRTWSSPNLEDLTRFRADVKPERYLLFSETITSPSNCR